MAGTDRARNLTQENAPGVILVRPQMGENIGAAARAMNNFALSDLHLVCPRDGWPNPAAVPMAAGAGELLEKAGLYRSLEEAIAPFTRIYATTVRPRELLKDVMTPNEAALDMRQHLASGGRAGVLFGPEKAGLNNEDVVLADKVISIPVNPGYGSINLAQAVLIIAYEWFQSGDKAFTPPEPLAEPARKEDLLHLFAHVEGELDARRFFNPPEKRASTLRKLRTILTRAGLYEPDIRLLRGVIKALSEKEKQS